MQSLSDTLHAAMPRRTSILAFRTTLLLALERGFLTAILPHDHPGYLTVKAALCSPIVCQKDMDQDPAGFRFPGVLTEKYVGHDQPDLHSEVTTDYVMVVPKIIQLAPGSVVLAGEKHYRVRIPHLLDAYKNEYEIRRVEDC